MREIEIQCLLQPVCRVPVVGAVHHEQRMAVHYGKSAGPDCPCQPFSHLLFRHRKPAFSKSQYRFHSQRPVINLPASQKSRFQSLHSFIGKALLLKAIADIPNLFPADLPEICFHLLAGFQKNFPRFRTLSRTDHFYAGFYDTGFYPGDFLYGISQKSHMVKANLRKYRYQRGLHHIGSVCQASHTAFQHNNIAVHFPKPEKGHGRLHLKGGRMGKPILHHLLTGFPDLAGQTCHSFSRYVLFVYLNPFPIIKYSRRNIPSYPVPGFFQNRRNIGQRRALSVRSRNMHKLQLILGIAQPPHQLRHRVKPQNRPVSGCIVYKSSRFFIRHFSFCLFLSKSVLIIVYRKTDCKLTYIPFMVSAILFFCRSTLITFTSTTSPTLTTSSGCLIYRSVIWEICTRPS